MILTKNYLEEIADSYCISKKYAKEIIAIALKIVKDVETEDEALIVFSDAIGIFVIKERAKLPITQTRIEFENGKNQIFIDFVNHNHINIEDVKTTLEQYLYVLSIVFNIQFAESLQFIKSKKYIEKLRDSLIIESEPAKSYLDYAFDTTLAYIDKST